MEKYICFLRGVNVSGKNKIKMADLKSNLEDAGFINVITYIQSGNLIFDYNKTPQLEISYKITETIKTRFNLDVPCLVISREELEGIFKSNPYISKVKEVNHLHVTMLSDYPDLKVLTSLKKVENKNDEFKSIGKNIYLYLPDGAGRTKLTNNLFENKLKLFATTRNWKTFTKMIELSD